MSAIGIKFRPSEAQRWMTCTASVQAVAGVERRPTSSYASAGIVAHRVFEAGGLQLGHRFDDAQAFPVDAEMLEHAADAREYLAKVLAAYPQVLYSRHEWRLNMPLPNGITQQGVIDYVAVVPGRVIVADYKYGKGVREYARNNEQMRLYATAVLAELKSITQIDTVELHIMQPRLGHYDRDVLPVEALRIFWVEVADAVTEALGPAPRFAPSEAACRWCPIAATCRARAGEVHKMIAPEFVLRGVAEEQPMLGEWLKPAELPPEVLSTMLGYIPQIRDWCNAVEARLRGLVEQALESSGVAQAHGWKLKQGRSSRAWRDDDAAMRLFRRFKLKAEEYTVKSLLSVAQTEKLVGAALFKRKAKDAVKLSYSKPSLVHEWDKAPALTGKTIAEEFGINETEE